ncbi:MULTISPECIES: TrkH family potassium uptake protein [Sporolactobacillus]|uniref:Ktr system potassium transporter B n=2 Tax=Sporolactobacillus TaxID=2077 RepID=A0A0U1QRI1_9BACL|nr:MULTISPECIES: TrkH family potassium uptake protein [Sporolactobacillus]KLI03403.1 Ktr system potassium transporter B [Sporolactobacillus inulinus CASD]UAK18080.1 TrkH family potassium uptake protein [Sporolactobacillus terrae]BBN97838.1 Ktr system potassium transporter B [Sporolactobacillus terrae]GEB78450.1 Ktr system potassium transporter B [Sporolactobacillus inulinus]
MVLFERLLKKLDVRAISTNPPLLLSMLLFVLILVGTVLLKLPIAARGHLSWIDALFFSTSASTVTGLTPFEPSETFTLFGQVVLMVLIQIGGIGVMAFAVFFVILLGKKVSIRQRQLMQEALNAPSLGGVIRLVSWILIVSFAIELVGMFFLAFRFVPDFGWGMGLYYSLFHSISGFNQAGFSLFPGSMNRYLGDPIVNLTMITMITIGGIGFTVLAELLSTHRFRKLSIHAQVMLSGTLVINVVMVLAIFVIEYGNPHSLGPLSFVDKLWAAFFQGISPRTAGITTLDPAGLSQASLLLTMLMMFIGAGSTSTSGGIKLTTFMIVLAQMLTFLKGRREVVINKRTIRHQVIIRAVSVISISLIVVLIGLFLLCLSEDQPFLVILFEVISAFGTAGESIGATADLSPFGKAVIMLLMFFGKVGPLTMAFSVTKRSHVDIRYPDGEIYTG